ncbi:dimethylhistidine N-methyltransferase [Gelidibacter algens]|uniref:Dimethylhistidine N-methyltransferase n=1 Tax=Gelidibacter algens TaxID=49280 RepID=A0A1A7QZC3_9FLAO|nr:L-histidine N(alpha)-methyltransferase [Gelidibacter algens]OBX24618.1 dimethylhistidine N-methyltransferase [Gelidibacter algens]RAJ27774.1 dimethylhistidine N-methyltransferase [Gelidibacter algens]
MNNNFQRDIDLGLSAQNKTLPSKYFYDEIGDALFVEIMKMPEYYLTKAEFDIFKNKSQELIKVLKLNPSTFFELVELGAGDGTKTKQLLKALDDQNYNFEYMPIDISKNALKHLKASVNAELPTVRITPKQGDYFNVLADLKQSEHPIVVLFLGSNIGNLPDERAKEFIQKLSDNLKVGDRVLLGVDLIKSESIVLPAYNDAQGITKRFNLNLLTRINKELDANFDLNSFTHQPEYIEQEGIARSFLVSTKDQTVAIRSLNKTFTFAKNEKIQTETSRKYNDYIMKGILGESSLKIIDRLTDSQNLFADYILENGH